MARDMRTVVGEMPLLILFVSVCSVKSCSIYYGALNYERKHLSHANTLCLFIVDNKETIASSRVMFVEIKIPFSFHRLPAFRHHTLWGYLRESHLESQTNQYAVIVSTSMFNVETGSWGRGELSCISTPVPVSRMHAAARWCFYPRDGPVIFTTMHSNDLFISHWLNVNYWFQKLVCLLIANIFLRSSFQPHIQI